MRLAPKAVIVLAVSAVSGALIGFVAFRTALYFSPAGQKLQHEFIDACRSGDTRTMDRLYLAGASPTAEAGIYGPGEPLFPPVIAAAEEGRPEAVRWLIDHGADINVWVADGWSPLGAAQVKQKEAQQTVDILKSHGAKLAHDK
jgi:Ankyrin repeats (many copies)